jgi:hypothetical protein
MQASKDSLQKWRTFKQRGSIPTNQNCIRGYLLPYTLANRDVKKRREEKRREEKRREEKRREEKRREEKRREEKRKIGRASCRERVSLCV